MIISADNRRNRLGDPVSSDENTVVTSPIKGIKVQPLIWCDIWRTCRILKNGVSWPMFVQPGVVKLLLDASNPPLTINSSACALSDANVAATSAAKIAIFEFILNKIKY